MNQELWNKVIRAKAVINCRSNADAQSLLEYFKTQNIIWSGRVKLTDDLGWDWHEENTIYYIDNRKLTLAHMRWHKENFPEQEIIDCEDLLNCRKEN